MTDQLPDEPAVETEPAVDVAPVPDGASVLQVLAAAVADLLGTDRVRVPTGTTRALQHTPGGLPYPDDGDPVADGAAAIRALALALDSVVGPWQAYSPIWRADATSIYPGAGGVTQGRYRLVGRTVDLWVKSYVGNVPNFYSGSWNWNIPVQTAEYFPVHGWLQTPGSSEVPQLIPCTARLNREYIKDGATGPGNVLISGYPMPPGSMLLWHATYEVV